MVSPRLRNPLDHASVVKHALLSLLHVCGDGAGGKGGEQISMRGGRNLMLDLRPMQGRGDRFNRQQVKASQARAALKHSQLSMCILHLHRLESIQPVKLVLPLALSAWKHSP